jgi:hypothetical protein
VYVGISQRGAVATERGSASSETATQAGQRRLRERQRIYDSHRNLRECQQAESASAQQQSSKFYPDSVVDQLSSAFGISRKSILSELPELDAAVRAFRTPTMPSVLPKRWQPSKLIERLESLARTAGGLLRVFRIEDPETAIDGPSAEHEQIAMAMSIGMASIGADEDDLRRSLDGVANLIRWANAAKNELRAPDKIAHPSDDAGHVRAALRGAGQGLANPDDAATNAWLLDVATIYTRLTNKPATASWDRTNDQPHGFVLFIQIIGQPVGIKSRASEMKALKNRVSRLKPAISQLPK